MTNNQAIFIDSSAWISYNIINDSNHDQAAEIFLSIRTRPFFISFFILSEVITKVRKIVGQKETYLLYQQFKKLEKKERLSILSIDRDLIEEAIKLLRKYPIPNTFSLTDATNIALMQQYKIPALFSFDKDFKKLKIPSLLVLP